MSLPEHTAIVEENASTEASLAVSASFHCDWPECKYHRFGARGSFNGFMWEKPKGWRSFPLDDFEVHGCCDEHYERALAMGDGRTPVTGSVCLGKDPKP